MPLKILGLNHNTAPVEIREQVVFAGEQIPGALQAVRSIDGVDEAVLLSTCNRTEFYVMADDAGRRRLQDWLHDAHNLDPSFADTLFQLDDDAALRHIFRVACGLDSMVLGEPQILGQLKDAYRDAEGAGTVGKRLSRLFQHTFSVAKKVRTDTEIGSSPVSVAYAAVTLAQQFFSDFKKHTALLVGAGVTIELVAKHLKRKDIGRLFVASPTAVVTLPQMEAAIKTRRRKPIFAVDIAVPRDIEAGVGKLDDVYLYTIDDLNKVVLEGQGNREAAAQDANRILNEEIGRYLNMERAKQVAPLITALRENANSVRGEILKQAQKRLAKGADGQEVLEYATAALMKKMLHNPSVRLREAGENADIEIIAAARALFGIEEE
jgi:glutamyl-tRNA reductase